jgi:purine-binding chemotaxis protein CheW
MDDLQFCTVPPDPERESTARRDGPDDNALDLILEQRRQSGGQVVEVELPRIKLVIFLIGETRFAFPAHDLVEILPLTTIHFVPGCPPTLEGVINVRGEVASVIRLGQLLGLEHAPMSRRSAILLGQCRLDQGELIRSGLRVDRVIDVLDITEDSIQTRPDSLPEPLRSLATGLFRHEDQGVILLDLTQVILALLGDRR